MLERVVSVQSFLVACGHFRCVLVETLKRENNHQHLFLYLSIPGFCMGKGTTCVLYRLAILKYCCAKATLARITLNCEVQGRVVVTKNRGLSC